MTAKTVAAVALAGLLAGCAAIPAALPVALSAAGGALTMARESGLLDDLPTAKAAIETLRAIRAEACNPSGPSTTRAVEWLREHERDLGMSPEDTRIAVCGT